MRQRVSERPSSHTVRALALGLCLVLGAPAAGAEVPPPERIFTLTELLSRAEVIVLAEVGPPQNGRAALKVLECLKAPLPRAASAPPADVDTEAVKQAARLLEEEARRRTAAGQPPPRAPYLLPRKEDLPELFVEKAGQMKLLPTGTQGLFFLWDALPPEPGKLGYRLSHPQCIYEPQHSAEVKSALARPPSQGEPFYLRPWDKRMAALLLQRQMEQAVRSATPGGPEQGLSLDARALRTYADHTFSVTAWVLSTGGGDRAVYTGLLGGFGVRLRRKDARPESALLLPLKEVPLPEGCDVDSLGPATLADFTILGPEAKFSKLLYFRAAEYPALADLEGEYILNAYYCSRQDGRSVEGLTGKAWTGVLISQDLGLTLGPLAAVRKTP